MTVIERCRVRYVVLISRQLGRLLTYECLSFGAKLITSIAVQHLRSNVIILIRECTFCFCSCIETSVEWIGNALGFCLSSRM